MTHFDLYRNQDLQIENKLIMRDSPMFTPTFDCNNPCNPSMATYSARLRTFASWPRYDMRASKEELADAGYIYLGEYDKLKCFYCNGGLKNWLVDQDPWFEHAKWYPNCEYLLQRKGIPYVQNIASRFPNLRRPIQYPANSSGRSYGYRPGVQGGTAPSTSMGISPNVPTLNEAMESEIVREVAFFQFDENLVKKVVKKKLEEEHAQYTSVRSMVDDLQEEEKKLRMRNQQEVAMETEIFQPEQSLPNAAELVQPSPVNTKAAQPCFSKEQVKIKLRSLTDERLCKICLDKEHNCIFQPCNHVISCVNCATSLRNCPVCRKKIEKITVVYRN